MYYSLYAANKWVEPLDSYLADNSLTDADWFKFDDIIPAWRAADSVDGKLYGVPYDGEVTIQVYRKDLYDAKGLKPADDLTTFVSNAAALNTPNDRVWGTALRGVAGAGQNMYIYPSIFREFGGEWFKGGKLTVNGPEAEQALSWYVDLMRKSAPTAAANWNWPDIADAFSQGSVATYIDAHSSASVVNNPEKSKVIGKVAYARWPKGPFGKRVVRSGTGVFRSTPRRPKRGRRRPGCSSSGPPARRPRHAPRIASPDRRSARASTEPRSGGPGLCQADERLWRQFRRGYDGQPCKATPMSTGDRGCRNGRRSGTPWRRRSSRRYPVRPPSRPRSTTPSAASNL